MARQVLIGQGGARADISGRGVTGMVFNATSWGAKLLMQAAYSPQALHAKLSFVIMLTGTGWSHGCLASGIVTGWCMPQSKMFSS